MSDAVRSRSKIFADPLAALEPGQPRSAREIHAFCEQIDTVLADDPAEGRRLAGIAVRLAKRSGSRCAMARAWCALGACHRYADLLHHAETCYMLALAQGCPSLLPEILRRWSYLAFYRGQFQEARAIAHRSVRGFLRRKDSHNAGRALLARGLARKYCGDREGAHADYCEALSRIPPSDDFYYAAALQNLTTLLASPESTRAEMEKALTEIAEARHTIRNHAGYRVLRIRLRWTELLLSYRLRRLPAYKVRKGLARVVGVLAELDMPQDAAAAAADLAAICARHCRSEEEMEEQLLAVCDVLAARVAETLRPRVARLREAVEAIDPRPAVRAAARAPSGTPPPDAAYRPPSASRTATRSDSRTRHPVEGWRERPGPPRRPSPPAGGSAPSRARCRSSR